jgi:hypothetical protein
VSPADGGVIACDPADRDRPAKDSATTPKVFEDREPGTTFAPPDRGRPRETMADRNVGVLLRRQGRGSNGRKTYRVHVLPATRGLQVGDGRRGGEL